MAGFKTHVSVGVITGFILMLVTYVLSWTSDLSIAVAIFIATAIGSFMPDLDSDSGLPFQIIFGLYSLVIAGIAFFIVYNVTYNNRLIMGTIAAVGGFVIVRYAIGPFFKKKTKHRGMFHSVPAVFISFFATLLIVSFLKAPIVDKFLIALAVGTGYLCHLILDEIWSTNILSGKFKPKKSLGTAMKFYSKSKKNNIITYVILVVLAYLTSPMFLEAIRILKS